MTHTLAVYYKGPKAKPVRVEVTTNKHISGRELILSFLPRTNPRFLGKEILHWFNWLENEGIQWKLLRSSE